MPSSIQPGLIVLHGNRLELLRDVVFDWLRRHPLEPLEEEIFLVQSNAAAEWLKMALASETGICAATRFELPGRFVWRTCRRMLGRGVTPRSALDREALTWRLMRLLPGKIGHQGFESVTRFLADGSVDRRWQLARRLADLYDQYQVYRADWLAAWARGRPVMITVGGTVSPLPDDQRWQAVLWHALLAELDDHQRGSTRPEVHRLFMAAMAAGAAPVEPLPRRVVLFGASHVSVQGLEALAALARHTQVVCAIPNPSRYHWSDILDGREALQFARQRLPGRESQPLSTVPLTAMHLHAHPLLAAWGRQGRDFMRLLDGFDDADETRRRFDLQRIDVFDDDEPDDGSTLLRQVQSAIRDLMPLAEHPARTVAIDDRSIVFQVAHGPAREVEILHDALLALLAANESVLRPRDVIVMVPDIEAFAPAIRAVFGQHDRDDPRRIPFEIADLRSRGSNPLVVGLEWLLRLPDRRIRLQEVRDLLDVPAAASRAGIAASALPRLFEWLAGAGVRWGLDTDHRQRIGLGAAGEQNTWRFGLRRMLLGYATGSGAGFAGIEPYDEIGGLETGVVGSLIALVDRLSAWSSLALDDATPASWAGHARDLLADLFDATDERERLTLIALQRALATWLEACEDAHFDEPVPLSVMREAWLAGLDGLDATRRFMTGGVTFCTLMPLRAVPFEIVCLLGMNDGDFPRSQPRNDFDLLAMPGQQRPGDRSRRDDDRYLMLEALLSARRMLYVSWRGRSPRDNAVEPPSVLVAQLRDYLASGWRSAADDDLLGQLTTEHPLQPFSRRYFEAGGPSTFAIEWRAAHVSTGPSRPDDVVPRDEHDDDPLTIARLERFLRNPARVFFASRLAIVAPEEETAIDDDEAFELSGLDGYALREALIARPDAALLDGVDAVVERHLRSVGGSGRLPLFEQGARVAADAATVARSMLARWVACRRAYPHAAPRRLLRVDDEQLTIDDWLDGLSSNGEADVWIAMRPSRLLDRKQVRTDKLIGAWLRMLVACATGHHVPGFLIGCDATLAVAPLEEDRARAALRDLLRAWRQGSTTPLPFAIRTALAFVEQSASAKAAYEGSPRAQTRAENADFALRRSWPDYHALTRDGRFETLATQLAAPLASWVRDAVTVVPAP